MPVFKQIAKQQKRAKRKAEALLSDEESASDSEVDSGASDSEGESGSDEDDSDDDSVMEDDGLGGAGVEPLDEDAPRPPPEGFPTAQEALDNPVASTASLIAAMKEDGEDEGSDAEEEEAPLVCVFCPNKVLKKGKMTEVHLASKDHKRRLARFKAHIESPDFPSDHLTADARWVSSQLDKAVLERLSLQTQVGGKKAGTVKSTPSSSSAAAKPAPSTPSAASATPSKKGKGKAPATPSAAAAPSTPSASTSTPSASAAAAKKEAAVAAAEEAGTSVREQLRVQKKEANAKKRERKAGKKEKNDRIKKRKIENGESVTPHIPSKPKFVEKVRPTDEEIAKRQAWKKARDEAKAAGKKPPPRPVFAFEHGGKLPPTKQKKPAQQEKKPLEKKERVVNEARLAKRKLRKETRKAAKAEGKAKAQEEAKAAEVLPEV